MNLSYKKLALLLVIGLMVIMLFRIFQEPQNSSVSVSYSDFMTMVESERVIRVTIQGDNISGVFPRGSFETFTPKDPELINVSEIV